MRNVDVLASSRRLAQWLEGLGFEVPESDLNVAEREHLLTLRELLRTILLAHTPGVAVQTEEATRQINQLLAGEVLGVAFSPTGQPHLVPHSVGVKGLEEEMMAAATWAQHTGIWERLKVCANEECRWAFYDGSRNRSGSWCDMDMCGSRAKMRTYRMRKGSSTPRSVRRR